MMLLEAPKPNDTGSSMAPTLQPAFPTGGKTKSERNLQQSESKFMKMSSKIPLEDIHSFSPSLVKKSDKYENDLFINKPGLCDQMKGAIPGMLHYQSSGCSDTMFPASFHMMSSFPHHHQNIANHQIQNKDYLRPTGFPDHTRSREYTKGHLLSRPSLIRPELHQAPLPVGTTVNSVANASVRQLSSSFYRGDLNHGRLSNPFPPGTPSFLGSTPQQHLSPSSAHHSHPAQHSLPASRNPTSTAGFMSLAHILFQPKYPLGKKTFQCHECRYITDRKNNLKRHIATMHQDCGKFLECCDTVFRSKAALRDHVLLYHRTGYKCRFCGRNFCRKALLKRHLAVHNGQKQYICEVCDYATSHKSNLERHRRIHGFCSPIESDDGEEFVHNGPDVESYREKDNTIPENITKIESGISVTDETEEQEIDVESSFISSDDSIGHMDTNSEEKSLPLTSDDIPRMSSTGKEEIKSGHFPNDPLLEAFPVNLVVDKRGQNNNKRHKNKLYLSDRLRQTYEQIKSLPVSSSSTPSPPLIHSPSSDSQKNMKSHHIPVTSSSPKLQIFSHQSSSFVPVPHSSSIAPSIPTSSSRSFFQLNPSSILPSSISSSTFSNTSQYSYSSSLQPMSPPPYSSSSPVFTSKIPSKNQTSPIKDRRPSQICDAKDDEENVIIRSNYSETEMEKDSSKCQKDTREKKEEEGPGQACIPRQKAAQDPPSSLPCPSTSCDQATISYPTHKTEGASRISDKKTSRKLGLGHRRLYASPYKCNECGKGLTSQQRLQEHLLKCKKSDRTSPSRPIHVLAAQQAPSKADDQRNTFPPKQDVREGREKSEIQTVFSQNNEGEGIDISLKTKDNAILKNVDKNSDDTLRNNVRDNMNFTNTFSHGAKIEGIAKRCLDEAYTGKSAFKPLKKDVTSNDLHRDKLGYSKIDVDMPVLTKGLKDTGNFSQKNINKLEDCETSKRTFEMNNLPMDYSVRNLLRDFPVKRSRNNANTFALNEQTMLIESHEKDAFFSLTEDQGRNLPIKKRSVNQ